MDKRIIFAFVLAAGVLLITPYIFPPAPAPVLPAGGDSTANSSAPSAALPSAATANAPPLGPPPVSSTAVPTAAFAAETASVATPRATFRFSNAGGALIGVELGDYMVLPARNRKVALNRRGAALVSYRVFAGADTVDLATVRLHADTSRLGSARVLRYDGALAIAKIDLQYAFVADSYLVRVTGTLNSVGAAPARLAIMMPVGLASSEADSLDDQHHLAFVVKPATDGAESVPFAKVEKNRLIAKAGPFNWVASKSKYFLLAVLAPSRGQLSGPAFFTAPAATSKVPSVATGEVIVTPDSEGRFTFDIYAGPQQWQRLVALGHELEHANPYGGFMQTVVQPFATPIMRLLLWMHDTFRLNYGWVLVIFGVAVRIILWPLNQSAMRSSLRMQRIQPQLTALQQRYKANPEKMHAEYMKLLQSHGMTPFSQFSGCLPLLIPMPVLFALFFVFQNTIEFRGVSFLWLPDISQKDPYFILPIVMGISMLALSWVGLRNSPPNPQAKMMGYLMPVFMVVLFVSFPAGLNLYYAVQNVAALPQQWLIAKERAKNAAG